MTMQWDGHKVRLTVADPANGYEVGAIGYLSGTYPDSKQKTLISVFMENPTPRNSYWYVTDVSGIELVN